MKNNLLLTVLFLLLSIIVYSQTKLQIIQNHSGLVGFWDFEKKDPSTGFYTAYSNIVPTSGINNLYPMALAQIGDPSRYTETTWPYTNSSDELIFDNTGPFGRAIKFNKGHILGLIERADFQGKPLDISGNQPFTLIVWMKTYGTKNNHFIAGIWDEGNTSGSWSKYSGRRQFALFGGLSANKHAMGHISTTGAASFPQGSNPYAQMRSVDGNTFTTQGDAGHRWHMVAMTFDPVTKHVKSYLDGASQSYYNSSVVSAEDNIYKYFQNNNYPNLNPRVFDWPVYDTRDFTLKFDGYNINNGHEIYEHFIRVDLKSSTKTITYGNRVRNASIANSQNYRVTYEFKRNGITIPSSSGSFNITNGTGSATLSPSLQIQNGDKIVTSLHHINPINGSSTLISNNVSRSINEGAPFTVGRAIGLNSSNKGSGSQFIIDGVAVYNRVLSATELMTLSTFQSQPCPDVTGVSTSQITSSSALITWNSAPSASSYTLKYKTQASGLWTEINSITGTSIPLSQLLANTVYMAKVQSVCSNGATSVDNPNNVSTFTTANASTNNCTSSNIIDSQNKPVVASSVENLSNREAYRAFDNDITTRWAAGIGNNEWIYVDLGNDYDVNRIDIDWAKAYGKQYRLEILSSTENPLTSNNWQLLTDTSNIPCGSYNHCMIRHDFAPQTGRYVRFYGLEQGKYWGYSFFEMDIYHCVTNQNSSSNFRNGDFDKAKNPSELIEKEDGLSIYPNPANKTIHIRFNRSVSIQDVSPISTIFITDLSGKIVYRKEVSTYTRNITLNIEQIPNGVYFISSNHFAYKEPKKIIINH